MGENNYRNRRISETHRLLNLSLRGSGGPAKQMCLTRSVGLPPRNFLTVSPVTKVTHAGFSHLVWILSSRSLVVQSANHRPL
jgi:hypothetical protein